VRYVYRCPKEESDQDEHHPRQEVQCSINNLDELVVECECGEEMHRVPQSFDFYNDPVRTLTSWGRENFNRYREGKPRIPYP
jgi:hypothetical protein